MEPSSRHRADRVDLLVLGGGTGGLVSAMLAAGAGARVALVERDRTGGDCLWTGCVPSKALIAAADAAHTMRHAGRFGIESVEPRVDFAAVMAHVRGARSAIEPHDSPQRLRAAGVEVIAGAGTFVAPGRLRVGPRELRFGAAIVATGSAPTLPPIDGLAALDPLTSETVWELDALPARLLVLGGGPIGCELAQAFARLGCAVTLMEAGPRLLAREEPEAGALVLGALRREGVEVRLGVKARRAARAADGTVEVETERADGGSAGDRAHDEAHRGERVHDEAHRGTPAPCEPWRGTHVLVATGRAPRTAGIGLEAVGVELGSGGEIVVDDRLRTTAPRVFAVGDVTGRLPFTHVAARQARTATLNALFGLRSTVDYGAIPWATFTRPEVARVGMSVAQAQERWGEHTTVVAFDYADLDRSIVDREAEGRSILVGDPRGKLVGATIVAQHAGEGIGELAAFVSQGASIPAVSALVHAYPTWAEGPSRAADEYLRARVARPAVQHASRVVLGARRLALRAASRRSQGAR